MNSPLRFHQPPIWRIFAHRVFAASIAVFALTTVALGQCDLTKLVASDPRVSADFGISTAVAGDSAIIGARNADPRASNAGAAYLFSRSGGAWSQTAKVTAPVPATDTEFGFAVAIDGDTAIVGAPQTVAFPAGPGSVYVFRRTGGAWAREATLNAADAVGGAGFGYSVAIRGDRIAVGAPGMTPTGGPSGVGAVYVFERTGAAWTQQAQLVQTDPATNAELGYSVALTSDRVLAGAVRAIGTGPHTGAAYVFALGPSGGGWAQEAKLVTSDSAPNAGFGSGVALSDTDALVGAYSAGGTGAVYAFTRSGTAWTPQARFQPSDAAPNDAFGFSLALDGGVVLVGAPRNSTGPNGSAYLFARQGTAWVQQRRFDAPDAPAVGINNFGLAVAYRDGVAVIGARSADALPVLRAGAAYLRDPSTPTLTYEVPPTLVSFALSIGGQTARVAANFAGVFRARLTSTCDLPVSMQIASLDLHAVEPTISLQIGSSTASIDNVHVVIGSGHGQAGPPAPLLDGSTFNQPGNRIAFSGVLSYDIQGMTGVMDMASLPTFPIDLSGSIQRSGPSLHLAVPVTASHIYDLGLGASNPSLALSAEVSSTAPLCPVDFDQDGTVNVQDFLTYLAAFAAAVPCADVNGDGSVNVQDFLAFLNAYAAGC
jgi:hypothetical protein